MHFYYKLLVNCPQLIVREGYKKHVLSGLVESGMNIKRGQCIGLVFWDNNISSPIILNHPRIHIW